MSNQLLLFSIVRACNFPVLLTYYEATRSRHIKWGHVKWTVSAMRSFYHIIPEKNDLCCCDPLGNQSPPKHIIWRKNGVNWCKKCGLQRRARNSIKKIKKNNCIWLSHLTPLPGRPCGADFYTFWHVGSYGRRNHPCQILSRLVQGLGAMAPQNRGFPNDFECRSYNSVTH